MNLNTKLKLEYSFGNCSTTSLWNFISTPSGLSEWFADNVTNDKNRWVFEWENVSQMATVFLNRANHIVRISWLDSSRGYNFEMKIVREELTGTVILEVLDLIEEDELEDQTLLWNTQVEQLQRCMGVH